MTSTQHYVADLFDAVDALDATAFSERFTEDGTFRFGNAPLVVGRQRIEASVAGFFSTISGLKHEIVGVWSGVWEGGAVTSVETTVMYLRKDATVTDAIPVTSTLRMRGDLIADFVSLRISHPSSPRKVEAVVARQRQRRRDEPGSRANPIGGSGRAGAIVCRPPHQTGTSDNTKAQGRHSCSQDFRRCSARVSGVMAGEYVYLQSAVRWPRG
jgi:hypothetical protein